MTGIQRSFKDTLKGASASNDDGEVVDVADENVVVWRVVVSSSNSAVVVFVTPVVVSDNLDVTNFPVTVSLVVE